MARRRGNAQESFLRATERSVFHEYGSRSKSILPEVPPCLGTDVLAVWGRQAAILTLERSLRSGSSRKHFMIWRLHCGDLGKLDRIWSFGGATQTQATLLGLALAWPPAASCVALGTFSPSATLQKRKLVCVLTAPSSR